jgi:hypothetical protein
VEKRIEKQKKENYYPVKAKRVKEQKEQKEQKELKNIKLKN